MAIITGMAVHTGSHCSNISQAPATSHTPAITADIQRAGRRKPLARVRPAKRRSLLTLNTVETLRVVGERCRRVPAISTKIATHHRGRYATVAWRGLLRCRERVGRLIGGVTMAGGEN